MPYFITMFKSFLWNSCGTCWHGEVVAVVIITYIIVPYYSSKLLLFSTYLLYSLGGYQLNNGYSDCKMCCVLFLWILGICFSRPALANTQLLKCGYYNWRNEFLSLIFINLNLNRYTRLVTTKADNILPDDQNKQGEQIEPETWQVNWLKKKEKCKWTPSHFSRRSHFRLFTQRSTFGDRLPVLCFSSSLAITLVTTNSYRPHYSILHFNEGGKYRWSSWWWDIKIQD